MQRRTFIKNAICLGCVGVFASGCKDILTGNNNLKNDKFYYKSKENLPNQIRLEACSLCQLSCPECFIVKVKDKAPEGWLGYLRFKNFKKFVDDNNFKIIELSNHGEIFLNPELDDIIKYAYSKNIRLTAHNGVNLNTVSEATRENLVKYNVRHITVSIDGATPETYAIYRRGGDFNTVISNIKKINYFKKKYNSKFPKLKYQFIVFGHNEHEIDKARELAHELNMKIQFKKNYASYYSPVTTKEGLLAISPEKEYFGCKLLFDMPQIGYDGRLLGCYQSTFKDYGVNVFEKGLLESLNSPNVIYAKHMLTDLGVPLKKEFPCAQCFNYEKLLKSKTGLKMSKA